MTRKRKRRKMRAWDRIRRRYHLARMIQSYDWDLWLRL